MSFQEDESSRDDQLVVRTDTDLKEELRVESAKAGMSMSDYVRSTLRKSWNGHTDERGDVAVGDGGAVAPGDGIGDVVVSIPDSERVERPGDAKHDSMLDTVTLELSHHEARVIGNRLWTAGEHYREEDQTHVADETQAYARLLHRQVTTRADETEETK